MVNPHRETKRTGPGGFQKRPTPHDAAKEYKRKESTVQGWEPGAQTNKTKGLKRGIKQ